MTSKFKIAGWVALGALAGGLTSLQFGATARNTVAPLPLDEMQQLAAVFGMIKTDYVEPVDEKKLIGDAISGMVSGLDPHSTYFDKTTFKEFREGTTGKFVGVGIEIGMEDGLVKVVTPIDGSPAFRAGLKSGDLITKIDETFVKGLVLDLRNDPGGLLEGAIAISAAFLPKDVTVVSTKGQLPESNYVYKARPDDYSRRFGFDPIGKLPAALKSVPLVVLVNEGSASASEIVSGALQDHQRGVIMGGQTFGKGSVQTVKTLSPDTALKITTARYYTPNGRSIQAKGIVPDVMVDESAEGNVFSALRVREADLEKHITSGQGSEVKDAAREKAREDALKKLEEANAKKAEAPKPLPEFGSAEDFPLQQALNKLQGKTVLVSKTMTERKPEDTKAQ